MYKNILYAFILISVILLYLYIIYSVYISYFNFKKEDIYEKFNDDTPMDPELSILINNGSPVTDTIPKIIWSFWHDDNLPNIVESCVNSWKKYNPDFEVRLLNFTTYKEYLPEIDITNQKVLSGFLQRQADVLRYHLLKNYGGFWIDSTMICNKSLQWILDLQQQYQVEYVGFYMQAFATKELLETSPVIENWFISCVKNSKFMNDWCDEVMSINTYESEDDYLTKTIASGTSVQNISGPNYLICHVAAQKLLQKPNNYNIYVISAASSTQGPFFYQYQDDWDNSRSVPKIANGDYNYLPLIKLRGNERGYIIDNNLDMSKVFDV